MFSAICSARRSICGYIRNHKRVVILGTVATCVVGVWYGVRKAVSEAEKLSRDLHRQITEHSKTRLRIERVRKESEAAALRFIPALKVHLYKQLDIEGAVATVKQLRKDQRSERISIWEELKIIGFTRLFAALYSFCLVYLVVHVHLLIIAKEDKKSLSDAEQKDNTERNHEFLLSTIDYLVGDGLKELVKHVQGVVEQDTVVKGWHVDAKTSVTSEEFINLLRSIHRAATDEADPQLWFKFIIYQDKNKPKQPSTVSLLNEAWDVVESPNFQECLREAVDSSFEVMVTDIDRLVFTSQSADSEEITKISPPLARVIPKVQKIVAKIFDLSRPSNLKPYLDNLRSLQRVKFLCESIYVEEDAVAWPCV